MDCVKQFDMSDATAIPSLLNKTAATNSGKWGGQTVDMLDNVKTLCLEDIQEYTSDILKFNKTDGTLRQDQKWLLKLVCNSCSSDLQDIANETFNYLPIHQQGGSVYLKLIYDVILTEPVIRVIQTWIKDFAKTWTLQDVRRERLHSLQCGMEHSQACTRGQYTSF
jgi:hypothetical protein